MSSSKIYSAALVGLDAALIEVEADTGAGQIGAFIIVGLPDAAITESRERVRSAIKNSSLPFPKLKVTVNMAPADVKKHGPSYDLPIAVSILISTNRIRINGELDKMMFVGELALNGDVRPVNGILSTALCALRSNIKTIFVPKENAEEAKLVGELEVIPVSSLSELIEHLEGTRVIAEQSVVEFDFSKSEIVCDMAHIKGQEHVKRAMEIAAAGAHNMLILWTKTITIYF